ncbi:hypothetical protein AAVH_14514 [Aphelenchoides avenae]|nr:hypothetical protein AAVH_14514 [Aphelenchus avenae]
MRDERQPRPLQMPLGEPATVQSSASSAEDVTLLDHLNHNGKLAQVSSACSLDSLDQDAYGSDEYYSDDLDKLSTCLSEVSAESNDCKKSSLFHDVIQAQLALWTLIISIFYSYAWQQHRKKFLISLFLVVPPVIVVCCTMSSLLTAIVILGRLFSTPLRFEDMLKGSGSYDDEDDVQYNGLTYGTLGRRRRSVSGNSVHSSISERSSSCEELPKPTCRKHSTSNGSHGSGATSPVVCNGNGNYFGLAGRAASITSSRLSYTYAHSPGGGEESK